MKEKASRNGYHMCVPAGHHDGGGEEEGGGHFRRVIKGEQNLECDAQDIIARIGNTEGKNKNESRKSLHTCVPAGSNDGVGAALDAEARDVPPARRP